MYTRMLKCKLTEEEWNERANLLAEEHQRGQRLDAEHKLVAKLHNQRMGVVKDNVERLSSALRLREEERMVQCEDRRDEDKLLIDTVRLDTGEVIGTRPMTAEERQVALPGVGN
jgi:hypothetical protein